MGWVEQAFQDRLAYGQSLPTLWNEVRDSIGQSVVEFNGRTEGSGLSIAVKDCAARGKFCIRVLKVPDQSFVELFLDEDMRCFKISQAGSESKNVCGYELTPDKAALTFFIESADGHRAISPDDACKSALHLFILNPFPKLFKMDDGGIKRI